MTTLIILIFLHHDSVIFVVSTKKQITTVACSYTYVGHEPERMKRNLVESPGGEMVLFSYSQLSWNLRCISESHS